ncbi:MAG: hypothetical protein HY260_21110 [Chloroflexi bacterium]|nr:hypothetical protein [Chloroflexota bacterium]
MSRKFTILSLLLPVIVSLLVGCAPKPAGPLEVTVTLTDFNVAASAASVPVNTPIKFVVTNKGAVEHELILQPRGADDQPLEANGRESEVEDIEPGETKALEWTVTAAGDYQLACYEPGHFEQGMHTDFTVTK